MFIAIILGNRLNDDSSITSIQEERLLMALDVEEKYHPDYYIVSGGICNRKTKVSEAFKMKEYLMKHGISEDRIILEDKSKNTLENALYSVPLAIAHNATTIMVITSPYHLARIEFNTFKAFNKAIGDYPCDVLTYTSTKKLLDN